jgi:predicted aspartyl protease
MVHRYLPAVSALLTIPYSLPAEGTAIAVPFETSNNLVIVSTRINGLPPAQFLLDTGAEASAINADWAKRAGLKAAGNVELSASGGTAKGFFIEGTDLSIGTAELRNIRLLAVPLANLETAMGRPLGGIIGSELFRRYVIEIDYASRALRLHDPATWRYQGRGIVLPVTIDDETPFVSATLKRADGRRISMKLLIDTGNSGTMTLNSPFVRRHRLVESSGRAIPLLSAELLSGSAQRYVARVGELQLASLRFPGMIATLARDEQGDEAETSNDGLIGAEPPQPVSSYRRLRPQSDHSRTT